MVVRVIAFPRLPFLGIIIYFAVRNTDVSASAASTRKIQLSSCSWSWNISYFVCCLRNLNSYINFRVSTMHLCYFWQRAKLFHSKHYASAIFVKFICMITFQLHTNTSFIILCQSDHATSCKSTLVKILKDWLKNRVIFKQATMRDRVDRLLIYYTNKACTSTHWSVTLSTISQLIIIRAFVELLHKTCALEPWVRLPDILPRHVCQTVVCS